MVKKKINTYDLFADISDMLFKFICLLICLLADLRPTRECFTHLSLHHFRSSPKARYALTYCRAFDRKAVTTGLTQKGIEPRSLACQANALPFNHR